MFILDPTRKPPSRYRETEISSTFTGLYTYVNGNSITETEMIGNDRRFAYMYDHGKHGGRVNDVIHSNQRIYNPQYSGEHDCEH